MIIYKIQNKINGRVYIGLTRRDLNQRISEHLESDYPVGKALRKYGLQDFDISVIDTADNWGTLCDKEMEYINLYNCKAPNGYNLTDGGSGANGYTHPDEMKLKFSLEKRGEKNPRYGKPGTLLGKVFSETHRRNLSISHIGKPCPHSAEHNRRISESRKGQTWQTSEKTKGILSERIKAVWKKRRENPDALREIGQKISNGKVGGHRKVPPWNKGLTKKDHPSIAIGAKKVSEALKGRKNVGIQGE